MKQFQYYFRNVLIASILLLGGFGLKDNISQEPQVHTVEIIKMKFVPQHLTVKKGDKVIWINKDYILHDVTDEKNGKWTSKPFGKGKSWSKIITHDEDYFCSLHKVMKGTIKISS
ncbi:plastocyanin/azurin family copper-binding protein [Arenibacter latericius]|uniref:plastocyanin/azurin family copper-binding protein n=1 Tax=Arenibacter latericius TaxID=86104 RepID=UPI000416C1A7|nr:plastocyanin/azurin family copper-binding protein [Arenibacter latericius]MDX1363297.1 plastocyanin/azurin family copper-binding protein [Arenibacter latericius]